jgi:hypothetical protein
VLVEGIELLAAQGEVVWAPDDVVYLRPDFITSLVGSLCDGRMANRLWQAKVLKVSEAFFSTVLAAPISDHEIRAVTAAVEALVETGELREEYATAIRTEALATADLCRC